MMNHHLFSSNVDYNKAIRARIALKLGKYRNLWGEILIDGWLH